jgi:hypothetical protein
MVLKNDNLESPLILSDDMFHKTNISNKLISNEILEVKNIISKIIISTKANKNRLKKLYKKDKKINTNLIKLNKDKNKKFLKIVGSEIDVIKNNHKKIEKKIEKNGYQYENNKKIISVLKDENKYLKIKNKSFNDFNQKILFYQNENLRLSSKLQLAEKQSKMLNENLNISENKKDELIKLIIDLNDHFLENNLIKTNFNEKNIELINDNKKLNLDKNAKKINTQGDLSKIIKDIFS